MDLAGIVRMNVQLAQLGQAGTSSTSPTASTLLAPANRRLSQQIESAQVQLSAYGQIKSAFGGAQSAATGLAAVSSSKTSASADVVKAAQSFVAAFNQAAQAVSGAVAGSGGKAGALASDLRATLAGNDLTKSIASGTGRADLKLAGLTQDKNGTLTLDAQALQQALQANPAEARGALARLGQQAGAATGRELAGSGNVGGSVAALANRSQSLSAQQLALQQQSVTVQAALGRQNTLLDYATSNGIAAYRSLLSG